jgi:hypothetical protein
MWSLVRRTIEGRKPTYGRHLQISDKVSLDFRDLFTLEELLAILQHSTRNVFGVIELKNAADQGLCANEHFVEPGTQGRSGQRGEWKG